MGPGEDKGVRVQNYQRGDKGEKKLETQNGY